MSASEESERAFLLSRRAFLALGVAAGAATLLESSGAAASAPSAQPTAPVAPRLTLGQRNSIVKVSIHPGVGVMRVGNSADAFYIGPEVPGAIPPHGTTFRDGAGAIARQAARFRIFGYDAGGNVVGEVSAADAALDWRVHLVNRKAAWYQFGHAMDIPEASNAKRRNAAVAGSARSGLVLDAGVHSTTEGTPVELNASAMGVTMLLGELMTDANGRLLVLPGHGKSKSWNGTHVHTYANNDLWLDDTADGPVTASVLMDGRTLQAESAWVLSGPPNYALGMPTGWRTLHDILEDTWVSGGLLTESSTVSFRNHILPMFTRLARLQWVNAGILRDHGWNSPEDLSDPVLLGKLVDKSAGNKAFRTAWWHRFRNMASGNIEAKKLPPILGDDAEFPVNSPRQWIGPTALQWSRLKKWANGNFTADGISEVPVPASINVVSLAQRPAALDRATFDGCLGDAFQPGCEFPWVVRHASLWRAPYRLKVRTSEPDYGSVLSLAEIASTNGPLAGSVPGSLSRWMALPWQTDTVDCRSGYQPSVDKYLDTFWPARVPNQVLAKVDYDIVMDGSATLASRKAAFKRRKSFLRGVVVSNYIQTLNGMVKNWYKLGFVVARPGPSDGPFPAAFMVEEGRTLPEPATTADEPEPGFRPRDEG